MIDRVSRSAGGPRLGLHAAKPLGVEENPTVNPEGTREKFSNAGVYVCMYVCAHLVVIGVCLDLFPSSPSRRRDKTATLLRVCGMILLFAPSE